VFFFFFKILIGDNNKNKTIRQTMMRMLSTICTLMVVVCIMTTTKSTGIPLQRQGNALSAEYSVLPGDDNGPEMQAENTWIDFDGASDRFKELAASPAHVATHFGPTDDDDYAAGCLDVPMTACIGNAMLGGTSVIAGDDIPKGMLGMWNFDDSAAQDLSGRMNAVRPVPKVGPGLRGFGSSAYFNGSDMAIIEPRAAYETETLTISMWIYLLEDAIGAPRVLAVKGTKEVTVPSIVVFPTRKIGVSVSVQNDDFTNPGDAVETFESHGAVPLSRWTNVVVTIEGRIVQIAINSILDSENLLSHPPMLVPGPVYLAKAPWQSGSKVFIDDVQLLNRPLSDAELESIAQLAYPGLGARSFKLGCRACSHTDALRACSHGFSVCSSDVLQASGFLVSRTQGWLSFGDKVSLWTAESKGNEFQTAIAICCSNN
jgi:Concanavalin A-like lectin/glucanases superfamily